MVKTFITFSDPDEEVAESSQPGRRLLDHEEPSKQERVNDFMRKKTLAQGFLDIALLGANAAQLKRILTVGKENPNFILLLVLISMSIALQVVQAVLMSITGIFLDMNMKKSHPMQIITNNLLLMSTTLCVGVNVLVSAFTLADLGL